MKKIKYLSLLALIPLVLMPLFFISNSNSALAFLEYEQYELNFNFENRVSDDDNVSGNKTYRSNLKNDLEFAYNDVSYSKNNFLKLNSSDSFFKNISQISGLISLEYVLESGEINVSYGYKDGEYELSSDSLSNSNIYYFNNDYPSFFKIYSSNNAIITSLKIKYTCVEAINPYEEFKMPNNPNNPHTYSEKVFVDFPTFNEDDYTKGLTYTLSEDETYYIVDNSNNTMSLSASNSLIIPNTYNGLPVKEIGYKGFVERWYIFTLYVPPNITKIQNEAFEMVGLTKLYFDAIECSDFPYRNAIFAPGDSHNHQNIDVYIGPNVKKVPSRLLFPSAMNPTNLPKINSVYFAKNSIVEEIGDYAFYGLENLKELYLPDSIKKIGDRAFYNLGVDELILPTSLENIGESTFMFSKMRYVLFPSSLKEIGTQCFNYASIVDLDLKDSKLTNIPENCFSSCESLTYLTLPESIISIEEEAFLNCTSLIALEIVDNITSIGKKAFMNLTNLQYLSLGKNLKSISNDAFNNLVNLKTLIINSIKIDDFSNNNRVFYNLANSSILKVYFSKSAIYIAKNFFYPSADIDSLPKINRLILTNNISEISNYAFYDLDIDIAEYYGNALSFNNIDIGVHNEGLRNLKGRG